jgi:hypothetical protein
MSLVPDAGKRSPAEARRGQMNQRQVARSEMKLGHAIITMIEPMRQSERFAEYNRWYEFDHAYSALMTGPGVFSFRRWVAPSALKTLRYPNPSTVADPCDAGSFIATYFIAEGMLEEFYNWQSEVLPALIDAGRMNTDRAHVHTSLYDFVGSVNRAGWPVGDHLALDHPYEGMVALWSDRDPGADLQSLGDWLRTTLHPSLTTTDGLVAQALAFSPRDMPGIADSGVGVGERVLTLFFLQCDPRDVWRSDFSDLDRRVRASGLGTVGLVAPFLPVFAGTTLYHDQLW